MEFENKSQKKIFKKEINKHLKEVHNGILKQNKEFLKENQRIMLEKIEEIKTLVLQAVKDEVECQIKKN